MLLKQLREWWRYADAKNLMTEQKLEPDAYIYIETGHNDAYAVPHSFALVKQIKTNQVFAAYIN